MTIPVMRAKVRTVAGQQHRFVRRKTLGSEAVYQVVAECKELVELEVVSAPGLEPGMRMKVTQRAVAAMERLDRVKADGSAWHILQRS